MVRAGGRLPNSTMNQTVASLRSAADGYRERSAHNRAR